MTKLKLEYEEFMHAKMLSTSNVVDTIVDDSEDDVVIVE
jgi:hypothetical protein